MIGCQPTTMWRQSSHPVPSRSMHWKCWTRMERQHQLSARYSRPRWCRSWRTAAQPELGSAAPPIVEEWTPSSGGVSGSVTVLKTQQASLNNLKQPIALCLKEFCGTKIIRCISCFHHVLITVTICAGERMNTNYQRRKECFSRETRLFALCTKTLIKNLSSSKLIEIFLYFYIQWLRNVS